MLASETHPLAAIELAEAIATSDVPGGVVNLLTGYRSELAPWLAAHVDVNALDLPGTDADLERAAADSVKRVHRGTGRRPEPVGDRCLPRAEDRLAPHRRLARSHVSRLAQKPWAIQLTTQTMRTTPTYVQKPSIEKSGAIHSASATIAMLISR